MIGGGICPLGICLRARLLPSPSPPPHGVAGGERLVTVVSPKYRSTVGREASWSWFAIAAGILIFLDRFGGRALTAGVAAYLVRFWR